MIKLFKKKKKGDPINVAQPVPKNMEIYESLRLSSGKKSPFYKLKKFIAKNHKKITWIISGILTVAIFTLLVVTKGQPIKDITSYLQNLDFDIYLSIVITTILLTFLYDIAFVLSKLLLKKKSLVIFRKKVIPLTIHLYTLIVCSVIIYLAYVIKHPRLTETFPLEEGHLLTYEDKVRVKFNVPVRVDKLKPSITPEIEGEWKWTPYLGIDGLTREGYFEMKVTPYFNSRFVAYFAGINKLTDSTEHEYGLIFYSIPDPSLLESYPENNQDEISVDTEISLKYANSLEETLDYSISFEPNIEFEKTMVTDSEIKIKPKENLSQSQKYKLIVKKFPKRVDLSTGETVEKLAEIDPDIVEFQTVRAPHLQSINPQGEYVRSEDQIVAVFETSMNRESVEKSLVIEPAFEFTVNWKDDKTINIVPNAPLPKDTRYSVKFKGGIQSKSGGIISDDINHNFKTIGKVQIGGIEPGAEQGGVSEYTSIKVYFDQDVNKESAQSKFSIQPAVAGTFSWEGNVMVFKPNAPLALGNSYLITVLNGVESIYGLPSDSDIQIRFYIRPNQVLLALPQYYQSRRFSCNINTARIIMGWKGVGVPSEDSLIAEIGYNSNQVNGQWTGNPYNEFIGTADGNYGYGTYWPTIQSVLANRGISSSIRQGWNTTALAYEIEAGNPVIVWRYNGVGGGQNISWTASDGTYIYAYNGMHGSVVTGFLGSADNPTSFRVNDPWLGQIWINRDLFDWYWSFSGRIGLIIY